MQAQSLFEHVSELLPGSRNTFLQLPVVSISRVLIFSLAFAATAVGVPNAAVADGEGAHFSEPLEGNEFDVNDPVRIEITGDADSDYTIRVRRIGGGYDSSFNVTTNSQGVYSYLEISGGTLPTGDYSLQVFEGHNNPNRTSLDSISIKVTMTP